MAIAKFGGQSQQRWGDNTASVGETFRDFLITDLKGVPQQTMLARKKGFVLIAFFTTMDETSAELLPLLQSLADAYKESGKLSLLGVCETDDDAAVSSFVATRGAKFPVMIDRERYHATNYGFTLFPTLILINGNGEVQHKAKGIKVLDALQVVSDKIGAFAGAAQVARLEGAAFVPAVMPPPPPPAEPAPASAPAPVVPAPAVTVVPAPDTSASAAPARAAA